MLSRRKCPIPEVYRDEAVEEIYRDALSEFNEREYRFILVGKTGCGKSSTGNTITGKKEFDANLSADSSTQVCKVGFGSFGEKKLVVVDSPGICDTKRSHEDIKTELVQVITMTTPGAHAFLLVLSINQRFTLEEREVVKKLKDLFGLQIVKCLIVIFTHADELEHRGITLENYIGSCAPLKQLLQECQNRYLTVNNRYAPGQSASREKFMANLNAIVIAMLAEANYKFYTNDDFRACDRYLTEVETQTDKERIIADLKLKDEEINRRYKEKLMSIDKDQRPPVPQKKPIYLDNKHQGTFREPIASMSERKPAQTHPHSKPLSETVNQPTPDPLMPKPGHVLERINSIQQQLHEKNIPAIGVRHVKPKRLSLHETSVSYSDEDVRSQTLVNEYTEPVENPRQVRYNDGSTGRQTQRQTCRRNAEEARKLAEQEYERDIAELKENARLAIERVRDANRKRAEDSVFIEKHRKLKLCIIM